MAEHAHSDRKSDTPTADMPTRGVGDPLLGFVIHDVYEIRDRIDAGGMGVVYLAWDRGLQRFVAVKTLRPAGLSPPGGAALEEAAHLARIDHPAFVTVMHASIFQHPSGDRCAFFVMEYIKDARPLLMYAHSKSLKLDARLELFGSLCEAVRHLHEREGLIHFDLKHANVLVDDLGRVRVIDLGVARMRKHHAADIPGGTLTYMSPERISGRAADLDHRCDIWSLGVMLYMLLSGGVAPFSAPDDGEARDRVESLRRAICEEAPAPLNVDPALGAIVERALAKSPSDRYESVAAMLDDLRAFRGERGRPLPPLGVVAQLSELCVGANPGARSRRRPLMAGVMAAVIALVAVLIAIPLTPIFTTQWTQLQPAFGRWLLQPPGVGSAAPLAQTAIIEFGDSTDAEAIASKIGVEGVVAKRVVSHRRLHGELCRRLVASGAGAVVFDIVFRSETEYDESFALGIRALREAGIGVVIATPQWMEDEAMGKPVMSDRLWREGVGWGCYAMQEIDGHLVVPLVVKRADAIMPSLPIAGFAAGRAYGGDFSLTLDAAKKTVNVHYWKSGDACGPRAGAPPDQLKLTTVETFDHSVPRTGLSMGYRDEDQIGMYFTATIDRSAMESVSHAYEDIFEANETELRQWFSNRVVLIGNTSQAGRDFHPVGGDLWPGVYLQAAATESLLRRHRTSAPSDATIFGIGGLSAFVSAFMFVLIGPVAASRRSPKWALSDRRRGARLGGAWLLVSLSAAPWS